MASHKLKLIFWLQMEENVSGEYPVVVVAGKKKNNDN